MSCVGAACAVLGQQDRRTARHQELAWCVPGVASLDRRIDPRSTPAYTVAEAAALVRVPVSTLKTWIHGAGASRKGLLVLPPSSPRLLAFSHLVGRSHPDYSTEQQSPEQMTKMRDRLTREVATSRIRASKRASFPVTQRERANVVGVPARRELVGRPMGVMLPLPRP